MSSQNYTLGRGKVYFDRFAPNSRTPVGERYFGHTPEFSLSVEAENLDHWNADGGVKEKDDSALLQITRMASFVTDSIVPENIALFFLGESSVIAEAGGAVTDEAISDVKLGYTYQLGVDATNVAGVRDVSAVTVENGATPLVLGTDYTLDAELGRITILETATNVDDGEDLTVDYTAGAYSINQVITQNDQINGAVRFIADNAKGENRDYYMPYVRISPTGDFALKSDEWQSLGFSVEILVRDSTTAAIYANGRPYNPTP